MFRLEYLKVNNHPQLGDLELYLSENNEVKNVSKPYTSVIIGPNGTGKSYILKTIADVFRQFKTYSDTEEKKFNLPFDVHLRYKFYHNTYEIVTRKLRNLNSASRKSYLFFNNRPFDKEFYNKESGQEIITGFEVLHQELEYPEKLLVNSIIPTDRFVWQSSSPTDFYQYLGVRSTSSTTSTKSSSRRTIKHLFNATSANAGFIYTLKELLKFLDFEESFKVHYTTKINKLFFSGDLTEDNFRKYFEEWWDDKFEFSKRKKENPLWSIPYYNNNFKENKQEIKKIIDYLNAISNEVGRLQHKKNSSAKIISVDLFDSNTSELDLEMIGHLENLDIVNLDGIKIKKSNSVLSINEVSSGEYHLLISLIGIFANISKDSLVLIDEPEISLHPNWQMRYVTFLKSVFSKYAGCQFILTTHSHFLISDLEGESSSVTSLSRDVETNNIIAKILTGIDPFGWSAEDILYNVFNVRSTWNSFLEADLTELLGMISNNDRDAQKINNIIEKLDNLPKRPNDPLQEIILDAKEYLIAIQ